MAASRLSNNPLDQQCGCAHNSQNQLVRLTAELTVTYCVICEMSIQHMVQYKFTVLAPTDRSKFWLIFNMLGFEYKSHGYCKFSEINK